MKKFVKMPRYVVGYSLSFNQFQYFNNAKELNMISSVLKSLHAFKAKACLLLDFKKKKNQKKKNA